MMSFLQRAWGPITTPKYKDRLPKGFTYKDYQLSDHQEELDNLAEDNLIDLFKRIDEILEPWEKERARALARHNKLENEEETAESDAGNSEEENEENNQDYSEEENGAQSEEDASQDDDNDDQDNEDEEEEEGSSDREEDAPSTDDEEMETSFQQETEEDDRPNPDLMMEDDKADKKKKKKQDQPSESPKKKTYNKKDKPVAPLIDYKIHVVQAMIIMVVRSWRMLLLGSVEGWSKLLVFDRYDPDYSERLTLKKDTPFDSLGEIELDKRTLQVLQDSKLTETTRIQARSLPHLMDMKDVTMLSKTGTGKTLAFLLPLVEVVTGLRVKARQGTKVVILSPSQELARQTHTLLHRLLAPHPQTAALVCGHMPKEQERKVLTNHLATFVVATPARRFYYTTYYDYHAPTTSLNLTNCVTDHSSPAERFLSLVVDEADLMLTDDLYRTSILEIMGRLDRPTHWYQKVLVCATVNEQVRLFAQAYFRSQACITIGKEEEMATVRRCAQHAIRVETPDKLALLYTFLRKCQEHKVKNLVFLSTCSQVQFYHELFNYINIPVCAIHSGMDKAAERRTLRRFQREPGLGLLCTDVLSRGMDLPDVGAVLQLELPRCMEDYIHRVGRTARAGRSGVAYLAVTPNESAFLRLLAPRVPLSWATFTPADSKDLVHQHVQKNLYLKKSARSAFSSTFKALRSHPYAKQLRYNKLDRDQVAKSYGLNFAPKPTAKPLRNKPSR
ncbi:DDX18 [Cordylochernes scorpioides]|uniref:ATP-dependent RNA helicase n=1 Tax=Cordylochernes scorpioides TaxID=51811 RepID=A0ABY6LGP6_9ARAC|nr:DDX18 [Cordylochernes scorpioides]